MQLNYAPAIPPISTGKLQVRTPGLFLVLLLNGHFLFEVVSRYISSAVSP